MDGGSTIGVPNAPIALPNIPHGTRTKAQAAGERCGRVAASSRTQVIFKWALVYRTRIGAGEALGAWAGLEGGLLGRGRKADSGERQTAALGIHSGRGDGARVRLAAG